MNYYNENDPKAAAWIRELIKSKLIPDGFVDERSITDVKASDLDGYIQCHFFAGIGGWPYALHFAGWPEDQPVWTGSCPCQPFSASGKGQVDKDERHLWPSFRTLITERRPAIVLGEQVASKDGRIWLAGVRADLEAVGYGVGAADLCAAGVGAPHPRQRLYWMAHDARDRRGQGCENGRRGLSGIDETKERIRSTDSSSHVFRMEHTNGARPLEREQASTRNGHGSSAESNGRSVYRMGYSDVPGPQGRIECVRSEGKCSFRSSGAWDDFEIIRFTNGKSRRIESGLEPLANGVPARVVRLRGYGNAIVPQVAAEFIQASIEAIRELHPH